MLCRRIFKNANRLKNNKKYWSKQTKVWAGISLSYKANVAGVMKSAFKALSEYAIYRALRLNFNHTIITQDASLQNQTR